MLVQLALNGNNWMIIANWDSANFNICIFSLNHMQKTENKITSDLFFYKDFLLSLNFFILQGNDYTEFAMAVSYSEDLCQHIFLWRALKWNLKWYSYL